MLRHLEAGAEGLLGGRARDLITCRVLLATDMLQAANPGQSLLLHNAMPASEILQPPRQDFTKLIVLVADAVPGHASPAHIAQGPKMAHQHLLLSLR